MKKFYKISLVILLQIICFQQVTFAQDTLLVPKPSRQKFKADPMRATMLAVVLPGLGQIYNRKYWKIPLVYAGFGSLVYSIGFNSSHYINYLQATQDFTDNNAATNRFQSIPILNGIDPATLKPETYSYYEGQLTRLLDYYKRYRDLSYIGIAAWYLVSIIDANVDASLFNYDISNNLDVAVLPVQMPLPGGFMATGVNVSLKINF